MQPSLWTPGKLNHKQNPSFAWKADSNVGRRDKTRYYSWNKTSRPVGHLRRHVLQIALGQGYALFTDNFSSHAAFPNIVKEAVNQKSGMKFWWQLLVSKTPKVNHQTIAWCNSTVLTHIPWQTPHPQHIRSLLVAYSGGHRGLSTEAKKMQIDHNHPEMRKTQLSWFPSAVNLGRGQPPHHHLLLLAMDGRRELHHLANKAPDKVWTPSNSFGSIWTIQ